MIICFILMLVLHLITPYWWWILVVPFLYGLIRSRSALRAFATGVSSAGLLWFISTLYLYLTKSGIVTHKVAAMMNLSSPFLMVVISTAIAMVGGGLACCTGYITWSAFQDLRSETAKAE